jgi:hypothetical protein
MGQKPAGTLFDRIIYGIIINFPHLISPLELFPFEEKGPDACRVRAHALPAVAYLPSYFCYFDLSNSYAAIHRLWRS